MSTRASWHPARTAPPRPKLTRRIRSRDALVSACTAIVNHVRGSVKTFGAQLPVDYIPAFVNHARENILAGLKPALEPTLPVIETLAAKIKHMDEEPTVRAANHATTPILRQVAGVGLLTALAFHLVIEVRNRFGESRKSCPKLSLTPREHRYGDRDSKRRIIKKGNSLLRRLLVQCANYVLRSNTDGGLERASLRIMANKGH